MTVVTPDWFVVRSYRVRKYSTRVFDITLRLRGFRLSRHRKEERWREREIKIGYREVRESKA